MGLPPLATYFMMPVSNPETGAYGVSGGLLDDSATTYDESKLIHLGVDLGGTVATNILAVANGIVVATGLQERSFGKYVVIEHTLPDLTKVYTLYGHMSKVTVTDRPNYDPGSPSVATVTIN